MNNQAAGFANGAAPKPAVIGGRKQAPKRRVLTSLTTQIFIYFGGWWDVFYYVLNILVFVYKGKMGMLYYQSVTMQGSVHFKLVHPLADMHNVHLASISSNV